MGMFTTIIHPDDGRELQIKCGWDQCETYKIGDSVKWHVIESCPGQGYLLDGIYSSYSKNGDDDWVVIKNHIIGLLKKLILIKDIYIKNMI